MNDALGLLEVFGMTPSMVALDAMTKAADVEVLEAELNDAMGVVIKIGGSVASVRAAIDAGLAAAGPMGGKPIGQVIARVHAGAARGIRSKPEFNPLIMQDVVLVMSAEPIFHTQPGETRVAEKQFAIGLIETQGFTAVYEAIDTACKAADVEVVGKEKLGGGFITIIIKGDVAAVTAAIEAGKARVEGLGKLIAAHVIARPSEGVLRLLPKL